MMGMNAMGEKRASRRGAEAAEGRGISLRSPRPCAKHSFFAWVERRDSRVLGGETKTKEPEQNANAGDDVEKEH